MNKTNNAQIMKFMAFYENAECLWSINSTSYKNRDARNEVLNKITEEMAINGFGLREIAKKINNIRSAYYQERNDFHYIRSRC